MTTSTPFRDLLHAANLQHGTDGFTSPPKEGVLRIFSPLKIRRLRPGLNPLTWVLKASTLPLEHRYHGKNPVTPLEIDPGTVRLVAQRLNHYVTPGPRCNTYDLESAVWGSVWIIYVYITLARSLQNFKVPALLYCILNTSEGAVCFATWQARYKVSLPDSDKGLLRLPRFYDLIFDINSHFR